MRSVVIRVVALRRNDFAGMAQAGADKVTYDELIVLFPELASSDCPVRMPARPFVRRFEASLLTTQL